MVRKITLAETMMRFHELPSGVRSDIEGIQGKFSEASETVRLDVPAYRLPRNGLYLLDGNHRCTGLLMSGQAFEVTLHVIHGPQDDAVLPDLRRCRERQLPYRTPKKVP